jgi:vitamin B12 transporter
MADSSFTTGGGGLALTADWLASARHRLSAVVDGRLELLDHVDHAASDPARAGATGRRLGGGTSVADEIVLGAAEDVVLVPAVRLDVLSTRGDGAASTTFGAESLGARDDVHVSPRVAARWRVTPDVTVKANAGRYFRPPTVVELFGDRGFVAGNPHLAAETGFTADAGVIVAPGRDLGAIDRVYLEVAVFGSLVSDLIAFLPTAGRYARARNVASARIGGVESAFAARALRTLTLTGNYTFLESEQDSDSVSSDGRRLPGRPRHELYLRLDAGRAFGGVTAGVFADLNLVSGNFLDEGNLNQVPPRRLVGAGLRLAPLSGLTLVAEVKNLLDHRTDEVGPAGREVPRAVADVLDYPLPGRALYFTCDWSF